jgi:hypothetical protein
MRTFAAVAVFLFGTTFLWLTASFAGRSTPPSGAAWTVVNVTALLATAGFTVAAWGLYRGHGWWEAVAAVSAVIGLLAVAAFLVGMRQIGGSFADLGVQINVWMHIAGTVAVLAITRVPAVSEWFATRLT